MLGKINWKPSSKDMRLFGLVLIAGFGILGFLFYRAGRVTPAYAIWSTSGAIGLLALLAPRLAQPFYVIWMAVGFAVGSVVSRVVLLLIFFGVLTPVAFLFRLKGRDALRLKKEPAPTATYWQDHVKITDKTYYERLF